MCYSFDQVDLLLRDLRSSELVPAFPAPVQSEALSMPSDDGFRFDDEQCIPPRAEEIRHDAEEHPIETSYSEFGRRAQCNLELFPEKYDFELKLALRREEFEKKQEEGSDHLSLLRG